MAEDLLFTFAREAPTFEEGYGVFGHHYHIIDGNEWHLLSVVPDEKSAELEAHFLWPDLDRRYDDTAGDEPTPYHEFGVQMSGYPRMRLEDVIGIRDLGELEPKLLGMLTVCEYTPPCPVNSYLSHKVMDAAVVIFWSEEKPAAEN